jgi:hypothetical protein
MKDTLGLWAEAVQVAGDLGYMVREEPLGDLVGGYCRVAGGDHILVNVTAHPADRLRELLLVLAADPRIRNQPLSRLLRAELLSLGQDDNHVS